MQNSKIASLKRALSGAYLRRALVTALVIGTILNVINQGDAIATGARLNLFKLALTYCVPFCVATYASWMTLHDR